MRDVILDGLRAIADRLEAKMRDDPELRIISMAIDVTIDKIIEEREVWKTKS